MPPGAACGDAPLVAGVVAELPGHTVHAEICRAVLRAKIEGVEDELPHLEVNLNDPRAGTALHWATAFRIEDAALALVGCRHFLLVNAERERDGSTALHVAAAEGLVEVVHALLNHPGFTAIGALDKDGFTAIHGAAFRGHLRCVELLLSTPAGQAAAGVAGAFDVVRPAGHWAEEAASVCDMRTALHMAAAAGHAAICEALLALPPPGAACAANAVNRLGATALHMAARGYHTGACRALLRCREFTALDATDARGFTALHWAAEQPSGDICAALLAREDFTAVDRCDLRGRTAGETAEALGHHEVRRLILGRQGC